MVSFKWNNVEKVNKNIEKITRDQEKAVSNAVGQSGQFIQAEVMQAIAGRRPGISIKSFDTGAFMRSIQSQKNGAYIAEIFSTLDYSQFLEWGTSKMPIARLHFTNTINDGKNTDKILKLIADAMKAV